MSESAEIRFMILNQDGSRRAVQADGRVMSVKWEPPACSFMRSAGIPRLAPCLWTPQATCGHLKTILATTGPSRGLPASQMRLIFKGRLLRDNQSLSQAGVGEGSQVHLVI